MFGVVGRKEEKQCRRDALFCGFVRGLRGWLESLMGLLEVEKRIVWSKFLYEAEDGFDNHGKIVSFVLNCTTSVLKSQQKLTQLRRQICNQRGLRGDIGCFVATLQSPLWRHSLELESSRECYRNSSSEFARSALRQGSGEIERQWYSRESRRDGPLYGWEAEVSSWLGSSSRIPSLVRLYGLYVCSLWLFLRRRGRGGQSSRSLYLERIVLNRAISFIKLHLGRLNDLDGVGE